MSKRVNYFDRQFLRAEDLRDDQAFHMERRRLVQKGLFRPGIVTGLEVTAEPPNTLTVASGCALDAEGRELVLSEEVTVTMDRPMRTGDRVWLVFSEEPSDEVAYLGAQNPMPTRITNKPRVLVETGRQPPEPDAVEIAKYEPMVNASTMESWQVQAKRGCRETASPLMRSSAIRSRPTPWALASSPTAR